jgi:hypothetical protein
MKLRDKTAVQNYIERWMNSQAEMTLEYVGMQLWTEPFNTTRPRVLNVDVFVADSGQVMAATQADLPRGLQAGLHEHFPIFGDTEMRITFKMADERSTGEWKQP